LELKIEHEQAQIVRLYADVATVQVGARMVECTIRGRLFRDDPPAVGDFVQIEQVGDGWAIKGILPRKSVLARRAAGNANRKQVLIANIDQVVVVFSATLPPITLPTLDRFLVVVEANQLLARIVINKMDLASRDETIALIQPYMDAGYAIDFTSAETGEGLEELRAGLVGKESALVGPSGVGKSSLLNSLYPDLNLNLKVGRLSEAYGKGRHTTVGGFLIRLPDGALVADTAGLREVGLWLVPPDELPYCFPEFQPYLGQCHFSDCAHLAEPGCAVRAALELGTIYPSRYESYVKLRAEATESWPRW
jgi:ribosome biogenesis GTPase / thiamine phosphate phosphatase